MKPINAGMVSVIATIVVLFVVVSLVPSADSRSCQLVYEKPQSDPFLPSGIVSQDKKALIRFEGFLKFATNRLDEPEAFKYMSLKAFKLEHSSSDYDLGYRNNLTLHTDCATISIQIDKDVDAETYYLKDFMIRPLPSSDQFESCKTNPNYFRFDFRSYYSCYKYTQFECSRVEDGEIHQVALVTKVLDLEVDGNPNSLSQGVFDKVPAYC